MGNEDYEQLVCDNIEEMKFKIRAEMESVGHTFPGIRAVIKQLPYSSPRTREKRYGINPKLASKNKWLRMEAIQRHKEFQYEYRQAFKRWKEGDRGQDFLHGFREFTQLREPTVYCCIA
jgi:chromosomal replication initiation ATPase DnaA